MVAKPAFARYKMLSGHCPMFRVNAIGKAERLLATVDLTARLTASVAVIVPDKATASNRLTVRAIGFTEPPGAKS
jgi:hypothetical protein